MSKVAYGTNQDHSMYSKPLENTNVDKKPCEWTTSVGREANVSELASTDRCSSAKLERACAQ